MATKANDPKKKDTAKSASKSKSETKSAAKSGSKSKQSTENKKTKQAQPEQVVPAMHWRREICGFVCLLLAIVSVLGLFQSNALLILGFSNLAKGLIGYGYYILPIMLLITSFILIAHHSRPVVARVLCALLVPVALGCLVHLLACRVEFSGGMATLGELYQGGKELHTGGLVAGGLGLLLKTTVGTLIGVLLTLIAMVLLFIYPLNMTIFTIIRAIRERPRLEYEDADAVRPPKEPVDTARVIVNHVAQKKIERVQKKQEQRSAAEFDLPVDGFDDEEEEYFVPRSPEVEQEDDHLTDFLRQPEDEDAVDEIPQPDTTPAWEVEEEARLLPFPSFKKAEKEKPKGKTIAEKKAAKAAAVVDLPVFDVPVDDSPVFDFDTAEIEADPEPVMIQPKPAKQATPAVNKNAAAVAAAAAELALDNDKVRPEDARLAAAEVALEIASGSGEVQQEYCYPPVSLLKEGTPANQADGTEEMRANSERLMDTLESFNIDASLKNVIRGPSVTRYELELDRGVKLSKLTNLADDIALSLGASGVRISAIPDKISVVGIEVPNKSVRSVPIREVIGSPAFRDHKSNICFSVGLDISSNCIVGDIAKLPHMLIAGTTGSGKSVCTNSLIISLLYKSSPEDVRLIMVDPKMVELGIYNGIPHLLIPVVTDPKKAAGALQWAVTEMMRRYKLMSEAGVRDLDSYNKLAAHDPDRQKLPKIVVVIDELADLMLVAAKEVEESICRVAQMGRASGMHLIIATQRPSADVITGLMKANIPSRIAFAVASQLESRIILDTTGAEKLVGKGDMLYAPLGAGKPKRVQGCFITDEEVQAVVEYIKGKSEANYSADVMEQIENQAAETGSKGSGTASAVDTTQSGDELLPAAVEVILETGQASVSMLQRRLKLGYARAARIVDEMEEKGIVGPFEGSKPRQLLITREQWDAMQGGGTAAADDGFDDEPPFDPNPPVEEELF
jgi:S-DNA-T family DNA segregation ATPase FtsK/SpoIIIE